MSPTRPLRAGELWTTISSSDDFVALVVDSFESDGRGYGQVAGS